MSNPRRLWLKRQHPDLFVRVNSLQHERLPTLLEGEKWAGYGNLFLLDRPERVAVRVSRSATQDQIERIASEVAARVRLGAVAVSPFISPGEQAVVTAITQPAPTMALSGDKGDITAAAIIGSSLARSLGSSPARSTGGLIVLKHGGFPPLYKPSVCYFDLCASGRLLVLSPFQHTGRKDALTREQCLRMNGWCEELARS